MCDFDGAGTSGNGLEGGQHARKERLSSDLRNHSSVWMLERSRCRPAEEELVPSVPFPIPAPVESVKVAYSL